MKKGFAEGWVRERLLAPENTDLLDRIKHLQEMIEEEKKVTVDRGV